MVASSCVSITATLKRKLNQALNTLPQEVNVNDNVTNNSQGDCGALPRPKRHQAAYCPRGTYLVTPGPPRQTVWRPPKSPFTLIQEEVYKSPWKVLVACQLLNKTSGGQALHVIRDLFARFPTPETFLTTGVEDLETLLYPLGLFRKRARSLRQFTYEYLYTEWQYPEELHGVGKYGADAYYLFCKGLWHQIEPQDHMLRKYHTWLLTQAFQD